LANPTNSTIDFPASASALRLANSSAQPWASSAILYINNWHGSASGGGETQLFFGSDATALTFQQLARIKFNLSGGISPARILATGEVVPAPRPTISYTQLSGGMVISWNGNYQLLASTNVLGLYSTVSAVRGRYTISFNEPHRFFVLHHPRMAQPPTLNTQGSTKFASQPLHQSLESFNA